MKPTIIAIVGNSGTGKTHLSRYLGMRLGIPVIVSHTTRPRREGETDGKDYFFISEREIPPREQMLTYTQYGGHEYFALLGQVPKMGRCVYVLDEKGLVALRKQYRERFHIIAVLLRTPPDELRRRGIPPERIARDTERLQLPDKSYDAVIRNSGTLREFEEKALYIINQLG